MRNAQSLPSLGILSSSVLIRAHFGGKCLPTGRRQRSEPIDVGLGDFDLRPPPHSARSRKIITFRGIASGNSRVRETVGKPSAKAGIARPLMDGARPCPFAPHYAISPHRKNRLGHAPKLQVLVEALSGAFGWMEHPLRCY